MRRRRDAGSRTDSIQRDASIASLEQRPFTSLSTSADHTDMNTTKRYVHPSDEDIREAMNRVDQHASIARASQAGQSYTKPKPPLLPRGRSAPSANFRIQMPCRGARRSSGSMGTLRKFAISKTLGITVNVREGKDAGATRRDRTGDLLITD